MRLKRIDLRVITGGRFTPYPLDNLINKNRDKFGELWNQVILHSLRNNVADRIDVCVYNDLRYY